VAILDADGGDRLAGGNPRRPVAPGALACLVYTSGTTGRPKGVMVGFACLATRSVAVANHSGTGRSDREGIVRTTAFIGDMGVVFASVEPKR
jgi:long-subunit acyl-CoA synthetase (AMP-forming)